VKPRNVTAGCRYERHGTSIPQKGSLSDRFWPGPGLPGVCRKQTLAGRAAALKISSLATPGTHAGGQGR